MAASLGTIVIGRLRSAAAPRSWRTPLMRRAHTSLPTGFPLPLTSLNVLRAASSLSK